MPGNPLLALLLGVPPWEGHVLRDGMPEKRAQLQPTVSGGEI
jgi:hypothetical protein